MRNTYFLMLFLSFLHSIAIADEYADTVNEFKQIKAVTPFFSSAYGYAVFPSIGKAGFIAGGASGEGRVYLNGSAAGVVEMTQISIGLQLGGQVYKQIVFFQDQRAYQDFTKGNFEFGANATAVAIKAGANAQAGTTGASSGAGDKQSKTDYYKGMIVFVQPKKGFMLEASLASQQYEYKPF